MQSLATAMGKLPEEEEVMGEEKDSRAISPWPIGPRTLGPRTLSPWHIKSQGPKGRGPNVPRTSGPWPQGPSDLRCQGLKVRGPKVRGPMGQGLFSLFFVVFGTVLIQAYIYRCHIIPPWLGKEHSNRVRHSNHSQAQRALGSRRPHSNRVSTSACDTRPELYSSQLTYSGVTLSPPG